MKFKRVRHQKGSFRKKGGRWELRFFQEGRRKHVIVGTRADYPNESRIRNAAHVQALLLGANSEHPTVSSSLTMGTLISRYEQEEMQVRHSTAVSYQSYLDCHIKPKWTDTPIHGVKAMMVERWVNGLELAPKTKHGIKQLMQVLFKCAMRWELTEKNPITLIRVKGGTKRLERPRILDPQEFGRLVACIKEPYRTMVVVAACLGLRVSEIMGLQWGDFDFGAATVLVQRGVVHGRVDDVKTEASKDRLPLDPALVDVLMQHRERHHRTVAGWLFANPATDRPYRQEQIQKKHIKRAAIEAGITGKIGWHTFRHSYRSWMEQAGASMTIQRELMRHASITTTMNTYGRAMSEDKRQANSNVVEMVLKNPNPMAKAVTWA